MPLIRNVQKEIPLSRYTGSTLEARSPAVSDTLKALYRTENFIGSYLSQEKGLPDGIDDRSFNPVDFFTKEEMLDSRFFDAAVTADTEDEIDAVRRQMARERKDRQTIQDAGALAVPLGIAVGFVDPINFIPIGGAVANTYKTGGSILKYAAVTGSTTAASTAVQEAALHATQLERTYGESAVNVGAGALLGGVLGYGVGKLSQYIDNRQLQHMENSMAVETRIRAGEDSLFLDTPPINPSLIRQTFIDELRAELTPVAGNKLTSGERKDLLAQRRALKERMNKVEAVVEAAPKIPGVPARKAKQQAVEQAEALAAQERQAIQDQLNIVNTRLKDDDVAKAAEGNLARLEQGIVPKEYQSRLDEIILENERATSAPIGSTTVISREGQPDQVITKPAGEPVTPEELRDPNYVETPSLQQQAADEGISAADLSAGAKKVADGEEIKGNKVGKWILSKMRFDPLTRTLTSKIGVVRTIMNSLAENPYAMDRGGVTSVEGRAKSKADGLLYAALDQHKAQFAAYQKAGGTMKQLEFNEAVSRALRNDYSDIPEVLASARGWRDNLYDPLKNEAIAVGLLPEDIDVTTAIGYLNRRWSKQKITANYNEFISVVSKWLKDKDIELRAEAEKARTDIKSAKGAEKTRLQAIIDKSDFKEKLDLEDQEYEDIARQIAQRIKGSPDGRLPYDWKIGEGSKANDLSGTKLRGPLRSRTFQIPDNLIEAFLENDIEDLGRLYVRNMAPDIELHRAYGDVTMQNEISKIEEAYSAAIKAAKTDKERLAIDKRRVADLRDVSAVRDRIRGIYGLEDPNSASHGAMRAARNLNYLRLMGGVVASSVPDVARIFMAEGFVNTFSKGLAPLAKNLKTFKVSAAEGKRYGVGIDALMSGRTQIISDVTNYTQDSNMFYRGLQGLTDHMGKINLMDYWTAGVKQLHIVTMQNSVIDGLLKGKIDKRLSRLGIDDGNASAIAGELKKHAEKVDGVWLSNAKNWDNPELEVIWGAALRKESDRVIIVPGQEKPLFMSEPLGKTILQFRSFMFSSTQRMTIAALQGQDHNAIGGALMLTAFGTMSYAFKQWVAGREIADDPLQLVIEGIDRSGALGGIMEVNNTFERLTKQGIRPILGIDAPAARFASRSTLDSLLGPTFGSLINTMLQVGGAGLDEDEWSESDTRALRRLLPYQNLTYLRRGFDEMEEIVGDL